MYVERIWLDGKVVVVLGAGGGSMGTATSLALAEAGATVVGVDISDERVAEIGELVRSIGGKFHGVTADVRVTEHLRDLVRNTVKDFGGIDGLANVAGGSSPGTWHRMDDYPDDAYEQQMALNLGYVVKACREVGRHMIERGHGGVIVNYSSTSAHASSPYHGVYGAAKAGVEALTRTLATEWGEYGIRVNCIRPCGVRGPSRLAVDEQDPRAGTAHGARVISSPLTVEHVPAVNGVAEGATEIASVALFLVSDLAHFVSGHVLTVDGAVTARSPHGDAGIFAPLSR